MRSFLPSEAPAVVRPKRARFVPRFSDDPDTRSIQIGVGATILVHLLLLMLLPDKLDNDLVGNFIPQQRSLAHQAFNIEMAPDEFVDMKATPQPPPMKFVETNPDAPDNVPDKTNNFGAQNQQAAQLTKPKQTGGDRPEMDGRKDIESTQVVSGRLDQVKEITPPSPPQPPEVTQAEKSTPEMRKEQNPLPGVEKITGENKDGIGSNIAKIAPHPDDVPQKVEGSQDDSLIQGTAGAQQTVDRTHPRPRPHLDRKARPALFAENKLGTANIGPMAVDARWSNYGQYLQKMMEAVQAQWEKLLSGRSYPASGSIVTVKFIMDSEGAITSVVSVDGGMTEQAAKGFCVAAITDPSPYGKWSDDMVAVLGTKQEMTFVFYYQ